MLEDLSVDAASPAYLKLVDQSQGLRWVSRGGVMVLQYRISPNRWRDLPVAPAGS
jgi:hypothetical protein